MSFGQALLENLFPWRKKDRDIPLPAVAAEARDEAEADADKPVTWNIRGRHPGAFGRCHNGAGHKGRKLAPWMRDGFPSPESYYFAHRPGALLAALDDKEHPDHNKAMAFQRQKAALQKHRQKLEDKS